MIKKSTAKLAIFSATGIFGILMFFNNCSGFNGVGYGLSSSSSVGSGPGPQYFQSTVLPLLQTQCSTCHVAGGVSPTDIYDYSHDLSLLTVGNSALDNNLFNKVKNIIPHTGLDQCVGDVNGSVSPCKELARWAVIENPISAVGPTGFIETATDIGIVTGWALDTTNSASTIQVSIYVDGTYNGGGTLAGTATANMSSAGSPQSGHYFSYQLPSQFMKGSQHSLYLYASAVNDVDQFSNAPMGVTTMNGAQFYSSYVLPNLSACTSCHQAQVPNVNYSSDYTYLNNPTPAGGGTAVNNMLIGNASGGNSHGGGNQCPGGLQTQPCLSLQQWWTIEFGQ